jgi:ABC-type lipoprotein release transport system permease subunit
MIIRNGIHSTLRSKKRSVLFTMLIFLLTVALTLGIGLRAYCGQLLSQMEDSYTSVAIVEYLGSDYPDRNAYDPYARDAADQLDKINIADIPGVKSFEKTDRSLAVIDGYTRYNGNVPYPNSAVLECMSFVPNYEIGTVAYTEDQLNASYIARMDGFGINKAKLQLTGRISSDWVPFFHYGQINTASGAQMGYYYINKIGVIETIGEGNLPSTYIVQGTTEESGLTTYRYIKNGVTVSSYTWNPRNQIAEYTYSPEEDLYYGEGKVISTYSALTSAIPYAYGKPDSLAIEVDLREVGLVPEKGKHYLFHGAFMDSGRNNTFALLPFYDECEIPPYVEVGDPEAEKIFYEHAEFYGYANNAVELEASNNISALEVFQQGYLELMEGRFPQPGETDVCVITEDIKLNMGLTLGDTISINTLLSQEDDRYDLSAEDSKQTLTIVGMTNTTKDYFGTVWVDSANGGFTSPLFGYELGRAVLDNESANEAATAIQSMCPANVRVTMYDQGYASAIQPLRSMESTALAVTIAAALGAVAVLVLFAFLFVGRQKETVQVMVSLGTSKGKIRLWLLSGATAIAGAATLAGALFGSLAMDQIIRLALLLATKVYAVDGRYSETTIGYTRETLPRVPVPIWPALLSAAVILILALILCALFVAQARRRSTPKKGKQFVRVPKSGTSVRGKMPVRFALLSAKRGGWRSLVVPACALVLSLFLCVLAGSAQDWSRQLDAIYDDANIMGQAVSNNGRQSNNLVISTENARLLWKSEQLDDFAVSIGWNYWIDSEMPAFGNNAFAFERRQAWIESQPEIVALNDLSASSEFINGNTPEITWLDGWQMDFLSVIECDSFLTAEYFYGYKLALKPEKDRSTYPCLVSDTFLKDHNLELGQIFYVSMQYQMASETRDTYIALTAVGTFAQTGKKSNIYVPLSFWCSPELLTGESNPFDTGERPTSTFHDYAGRDHYFYSTTSFQTCTFSLRDSRNITQFRDYLAEQGISRVRSAGKNRLTVILRDQSFIEAAEGLNRYISFSKLLFPILFIAVALLGFVISWLMINGRRMEFAILRGLGTSKKNVFLSFFLEQGILCLIGSLISCGLVFLLVTPGLLVWLSVLLFTICYLLGCSLAVKSVGKTNLMMLLSERE